MGTGQKMLLASIDVPVLDAISQTAGGTAITIWPEMFSRIVGGRPVATSRRKTARISRVKRRPQKPQEREVGISGM